MRRGGEGDAELPSARQWGPVAWLALLVAAGVLIADFEADYFGTAEEPERFAVVPIAAILDPAAALTGRHGLPAYDAVQLASACALRDAIQDPVLFAAFDSNLSSAAATEGLTVIDT